MKCEIKVSTETKSTIKLRCAFCNECPLMENTKMGCIHLILVSMDNVRLPTRCAIKPKDTIYGKNATKAHWKWAEIELSETGEIINVTEIEEE